MLYRGTYIYHTLHHFLSGLMRCTQPPPPLPLMWSITAKAEEMHAMFSHDSSASVMVAILSGSEFQTFIVLGNNDNF